MEFTSPGRTVLCFSHDFSLLISRQMLLEQNGCFLLCAMSVSEVRERLRWRHVDLIVLCQTLSAEECAGATRWMREYSPDGHCLSMHVTEAKPAAVTECELLRASDGPLAFARTVNRLLKSTPPPVLHMPVSTLPPIAA